MKGNRVLPNHKDASPRQVKNKGSQLRDTLQLKENQRQEKVADSLAEKQEEIAGQNAPKTSLKQSDRPKAARRPKGKGGLAQSKLRKDKTGAGSIKDIETKNAGVISQSDLALLMESLKKGDTSVLNAIAAGAAQDKKFAVTENQQPKTSVRTLPNGDRIKQLQDGTRDIDPRTVAGSVPGIVSLDDKLLKYLARHPFFIVTFEASHMYDREWGTVLPIF